MAERWTSDQNIKFVELYKNQTNLWNCLDPNYKNRDLRKASLEHIRLECNLQNMNEVTKKIKNLRSTYNQELLKIEKSKKSGSGTDEIYKPSIKWFDSMDYIMKIINLKEKETSSNLVSILLQIIITKAQGTFQTSQGPQNLLSFIFLFPFIF